MGLENAVERLAAAIERNQQGAAVAEIIRQRDAALKDAAEQESRAKNYWDWYEAATNRCFKKDRRIYALRGVITRMKKQKGDQ